MPVQFLDDSPDDACALDVEAGRRLVHDEEPRLVDQGGGYGEPPLHPPRERARPVPRPVREADLIEEPPSPLPPLASGDAVELGREDEVVEGAKLVVDVRRLRDEADAPLGRRRLPGDIEAEESGSSQSLGRSAP